MIPHLLWAGGLVILLLGWALPTAATQPALGWIASFAGLVLFAPGIRRPEGIQPPQLAARIQRAEQIGGELQTRLKQIGAGSGRAVSEAARLLEGEGGLLWLIFLLVVFGLARL